MFLNGNKNTITSITYQNLKNKILNELNSAEHTQQDSRDSATDSPVDQTTVQDDRRSDRRDGADNQNEDRGPRNKADRKRGDRNEPGTDSKGGISPLTDLFGETSRDQVSEHGKGSKAEKPVSGDIGRTGSRRTGRQGTDVDSQGETLGHDGTTVNRNEPTVRDELDAALVKAKDEFQRLLGDFKKSIDESD